VALVAVGVVVFALAFPRGNGDAAPTAHADGRNACGLEEARRHGTVAELAAALHLSPGTTRNHLSAIMQKLDAQSRIEAIRVAEERGWL
jgi:hypothetical protein